MPVEPALAVAVGDNIGFLCDLPNRKSFSPDAAYYTGPRAGRKFFPQAPDFAVEIRSDDDSGPVAERRMSEKRADYFAAGTKVVWDIDLHSDDVVRVYRASRSNDTDDLSSRRQAEAEPAVPGWTMPVDDLFDERIILHWRRERTSRRAPSLPQRTVMPA